MVVSIGDALVLTTAISEQGDGVTGIQVRKGHAAWRVAAGAALAVMSVATLVACGDTGPTAVPQATVAPALQAGQRVFLQYCNACHPGGHRGAGKSLVDGNLSDGEITTSVRNGRRAMPAFSPDRISDADLQSLIGYIHTLK